MHESKLDDYHCLAQVRTSRAGCGVGPGASGPSGSANWPALRRSVRSSSTAKSSRTNPEGRASGRRRLGRTNPRQARPGWPHEVARPRVQIVATGKGHEPFEVGAS